MASFLLKLRWTFAREVCIRLRGDGEFTCTGRFAGIPVWVRNFSLKTKAGQLGHWRGA